MRPQSNHTNPVFNVSGLQIPPFISAFGLAKFFGTNDSELRWRIAISGAEIYEPVTESLTMLLGNYCVFASQYIRPIFKSFRISLLKYRPMSATSPDHFLGQAAVAFFFILNEKPQNSNLSHFYNAFLFPASTREQFRELKL